MERGQILAAPTDGFSTRCLRQRRLFRQTRRHFSGRKLDRRLPWFPLQTDIQHRRLPLREIKRKGPVSITGHRCPRERDRLPRREQLVTGRAAAGEAVAWWSAQAQA